VLFWGAAFALGSRHHVRNVVIAFVLSVGSWYLFVLGLGVSVPVGILDGIL
jgi:putative tricarboxylic transport membrane protein